MNLFFCAKLIESIANTIFVWYSSNIIIVFDKEEWVLAHSYIMQLKRLEMNEALEALMAPVAQEQGLELYDIEYVKEGAGRILRIYIDKEEGIDLDDCERMSRAAEVVLDEADPIPGEYRLQVSSPGVERKLSKPRHYSRFVGHKVVVKLFAPHDPVSGRKKFTGILAKFEDNRLSIKTEDEEYSFDLKQVSACRLMVFD